jgi:hypothetical protein
MRTGKSRDTPYILPLTIALNKRGYYRIVGIYVIYTRSIYSTVSI